MKMKKVLSIALALLMVLSLASCGGDGDADGDSGSTVSNLTDEELVDKLAAICEGKTGEMPVETTSFAALEEIEIETAGFWKNWFNNMDVPEGAKIAVNQPLVGDPHVVLLIQPGEGMSAEDLKAELDKNANPGWMICMRADEVASAVKDGLVLFVMTSSEMGLNAQSFVDAFNA